VLGRGEGVADWVRRGTKARDARKKRKSKKMRRYGEV